MGNNRKLYNARYKASVKGKEAQRRSHLRWLKRTGCPAAEPITFAERQAMYDAQQGMCKLCGKPLPLDIFNSDCCLDHDHETGKNRALLHRNCNLFLGWIERNPELLPSALAYIQYYKQK